MTYEQSIEDLFNYFLFRECADELHTEEDLIRGFESKEYWDKFVKHLNEWRNK